MIHETAVIGDIHGNARALRAMLQLVEERARHFVFVGDYVNRGPDSATVINLLIDFAQRRQSTFVAGNHDVAFRDALDAGFLSRFLGIGGAATVRSYVPSLEGDVLESLRMAVPNEHRQFLEGLVPHYRSTSGLLVTHGPGDRRTCAHASDFHAFGHKPQHSGIPWMDDNHAAIDTGCGTLPHGKLTAFLWPERSYFQVSEDGEAVSDSAS